MRLETLIFNVLWVLAIDWLHYFIYYELCILCYLFDLCIELHVHLLHLVLPLLGRYSRFSQCFTPHTLSAATLPVCLDLGSTAPRTTFWSMVMIPHIFSMRWVHGREAAVCQFSHFWFDTTGANLLLTLLHPSAYAFVPPIIVSCGDFWHAYIIFCVTFFEWHLSSYLVNFSHQKAVKEMALTHSKWLPRTKLHLLIQAVMVPQAHNSSSFHRGTEVRYTFRTLVLISNHGWSCSMLIELSLPTHRGFK